MKIWDKKRKTRRAIWKRKGGLRKLFFSDGRGTFYGFETIAVFRGICADRVVQWCCGNSVFYAAKCEQSNKISGGYSGNAAFWEASQRNPSIKFWNFGTGSAICSRKQSISEGAMTALGISKRQEFYNQERRHWRWADAVFCIAV